MTPRAIQRHESPHLLFVNPWIHDFAAYDFWAQPIGLMMLAAVARKHGVRVSVIDCLDRFHPRSGKSASRKRFGRGHYRKTHIPKPPQLADIPRRYARYGIDPAWLREDLAAMERPDLICVTSMMTYWYPGVFETISVLRAAFPGRPIVLGGIYATLCADHAVRNAGADLVLQGPGEETLLRLIEERTGFSVPAPVPAAGPDSGPYPAWDLLPEIPYIPLLTTRGCPYDCAYCASRVLTPRPQRRSIDSVLDEIRHWVSTRGVKDFVFYDDALLVDAPSHALPLLEKIIDARLSIRFHTPNALHIRHITAETARLMHRAGFETLRLGLETVDFSRRQRYDHKVRRAEFLAAAAHLKAAGFRGDQIGAYLLAGLPGQSWDDVDAAVETVLQTGLTPIPAYYSPIPRTRLWPEAVSASRYDLASDPIYTNNSILPCGNEPFSWEAMAAIKQRIGTFGTTSAPPDRRRHGA